MKYIFHTCVLQPEQITMLSSYDKNHLANMTNAWVDEKRQEARGGKVYQIFLLLVALVGVFLILAALLRLGSLLVTTTYDFYPGAGEPDYELLAILLGSILLSGAITCMKRLRLHMQIAEQETALANFQAAEKPTRLHFIEEHIQKLLSSEAKRLVTESMNEYKKASRNQLIKVGCAILFFIACFIAFHLLFFYYFGDPTPGSYKVAELFRMCSRIAIIPGIYFIFFFFRKLFAYRRLPTV